MSDEQRVKGMHYVGRKSCGCVVASIHDDPRNRSDIARTVARWIKDGMTALYVTNIEAGDLLTICEHETYQMALPV